MALQRPTRRLTRRGRPRSRSARINRSKRKTDCFSVFPGDGAEIGGRGPALGPALGPSPGPPDSLKLPESPAARHGGRNNPAPFFPAAHFFSLFPAFLSEFVIAIDVRPGSAALGLTAWAALRRGATASLVAHSADERPGRPDRYDGRQMALLPATRGAFIGSSRSGGTIRKRDVNLVRIRNDSKYGREIGPHAMC